LETTGKMMTEYIPVSSGYAPDHWLCAVLFAGMIRVVEAIILYMLPLEDIFLRMQGILNPANSPIHPSV